MISILLIGIFFLLLELRESVFFVLKKSIIIMNLMSFSVLCGIRQEQAHLLVCINPRLSIILGRYTFTYSVVDILCMSFYVLSFCKYFSVNDLCFTIICVLMNIINVQVPQNNTSPSQNTYAQDPKRIFRFLFHDFAVSLRIPISEVNVSIGPRYMILC